MPFYNILHKKVGKGARSKVTFFRTKTKTIIIKNYTSHEQIKTAKTLQQTRLDLVLVLLGRILSRYLLWFCLLHFPITGSKQELKVIFMLIHDNSINWSSKTEKAIDMFHTRKDLKGKKYIALKSSKLK